MTPIPAASNPSDTTATPAIKRSHSEMGSENELHGDIPASSQRFTTPLVEILVGEEKYRYTVHEAFLCQCRDLKTRYDQTAKKSRKGIILSLPREKPKEMGQVIEYLYFNNLSLTATEPQAQIEELQSLWQIATHFHVSGMMGQVVQKLDSLSLAERVPALEFIQAADTMYDHEIDDDLRLYFNKVAPAVVRKIMSSERRLLDDMIEEGGSFASDLFSAYRRAFELPTEVAKSAADIKSESQGQRAKSVQTNALDAMLTPMSAPSGPVDARTEWDKRNGIPTTWLQVSEADSLLVHMAEAKKGWNTIAEAVQRKTAENTSIAELLRRYNRLEANLLRVTSDDSELLAAAKSEVEKEFIEGSEWPLVAARLIHKGGRGYEPMRLRFHCAALDAANEISVKAPRKTTASSTAQPPEAPPIKTEAIGGVVVENPQAINIKRRRRTGPWATRRSSSAAATRPGQARKKTLTPQTTASVHDVSNDEDENEMMDETGPRPLRRRTKTGRAVRQEISDDDIPLANSAARLTNRSGNQVSAVTRREEAQNIQHEPITVGDSDEEEL